MEDQEKTLKTEEPQMLEYEQIEGRLKDITKKIEREELDLDESLDLYEEAVNLGMKASATIEHNVLANLASPQDEEATEEPEIEVIKES